MSSTSTATLVNQVLDVTLRNLEDEIEILRYRLPT
jgi:hypothetical protein